MKDFKLIINGRLDVYWDDNIYKSVIQDVGDNNFSISIPVYEGQYLPLSIGAVIEVITYNNLNLYKFNTKVIKRTMDNNVPLIILEYPDKVKKVQRRDHVRVPYVDYAFYCKVIENTNVNNMYYTEEKNLNKALIMDISGGGIKLNIKEDINLGDKIYMNLNLNGEIKVFGKVVRVEKSDDGRNICGLCFVDMDHLTREGVIRFVFDLMRKQRKAALKEE